MKQSAGILLYRRKSAEHEVLLAHPGGPFWAKKDAGFWTIPKGEVGEAEDKLLAARREFFEETGFEVSGKFIELQSLKQKGGKTIHAWALEGELDVSRLNSNVFEIEWPPRSGMLKKFPEIDRAQWFSFEDALDKILPGQRGFLTELSSILLK